MFNKRYQVLFNDWMEDYLQHVGEKYDLNMSSTIRVFVCLGIIRSVEMLFPEYKPDLDSKETLQFMRKFQKVPFLPDEEGYSLMSKMLFEARKAAEYRYAKEIKKKKK
jgi:hypothetical protein